MLVLLNPFLLIIYLIDLVEELDSKTFARVLIRAALISGSIYIVFCLLGEKIFQYAFQANFASFQIFGGIVFLVTGLRFVFQGTKALTELRGKAEHIEGGIVMPIMTGPGTISASIIVGNKLPVGQSILAIVLALAICVFFVVVLKKLHDRSKRKNEKLIRKYIDIIGRVTALLIGTFSVEMIMSGIKQWIEIYNSAPK
jgi:small neutral amino acid transporter SnatA (MarC family)